MFLGQISHGSNTPETQVGMVVVVALCCCGIWAFIRWLLGGPESPDPWDETVTAEIEKESATPLCHRCLMPHDSSADFCPECGATVGAYTNWLPYPYLFSIGHTLRIGTNGDFKRSPLTVIGFFAFSLAEYSLFAPIYWAIFLLNLQKPQHGESVQDQSPPVG